MACFSHIEYYRQGDYFRQDDYVILYRFDFCSVPAGRDYDSTLEVHFKMNGKYFYEIDFVSHAPNHSVSMTYNHESDDFSNCFEDFLNDINSHEELRNVVSSPINCRDKEDFFTNVKLCEFCEKLYSEMLEMLNNSSYVLK
jgi:hypothetical protein